MNNVDPAKTSVVNEPQKSFWETNFGKQKSVDFSIFARAVFDHLKEPLSDSFVNEHRNSYLNSGYQNNALPEDKQGSSLTEQIHYLCLVQLFLSLQSGGQKEIKQKSWTKMCDLFGCPGPAEKEWLEEISRFFREHYPYFHGKQKYPEAVFGNSLIRGAWYLRISKKDFGQFILTYAEENKTSAHVRGGGNLFGKTDVKNIVFVPRGEQKFHYQIELKAQKVEGTIAKIISSLKEKGPLKDSVSSPLKDWGDALFLRDELGEEGCSSGGMIMDSELPEKKASKFQKFCSESPGFKNWDPMIQHLLLFLFATPDERLTFPVFARRLLEYARVDDKIMKEGKFDVCLNTYMNVKHPTYRAMPQEIPEASVDDKMQTDEISENDQHTAEIVEKHKLVIDVLWCYFMNIQHRGRFNLACGQRLFYLFNLPQRDPKYLDDIVNFSREVAPYFFGLLNDPASDELKNKLAENKMDFGIRMSTSSASSITVFWLKNGALLNTRVGRVYHNEAGNFKYEDTYYKNIADIIAGFKEVLNSTSTGSTDFFWNAFKKTL